MWAAGGEIPSAVSPHYVHVSDNKNQPDTDINMKAIAAETLWRQ